MEEGVTHVRVMCMSVRIGDYGRVQMGVHGAKIVGGRREGLRRMRDGE